MTFCDELFSTGNNKTLSAFSCVNRAIDTYPFKNNDRAIIHFNHDTDFNFLFSELFLNSSLIQLLNFTFNNFEESTQKKIDIFLTHNSIHKIYKSYG